MHRNILLLVLILLSSLSFQTTGFADGNPPEESDADAAFDDFDDEFGDEFAGEEELRGVFDPLSGYNRVMFYVNDKLYFWVLKPVARCYRWAIPEFFRSGVGRFFRNLGFPVRLVNNVLQFKFKNAGIETGRFVVNSTVGLLGFFDPAQSRLHLTPRQEDFGQTLGKYGVGDGFPLVLPLLGPSNLRDALGLVGAYFLNPVAYIESTEARVAIPTYETVNSTSLKIGAYESLKRDALDPYTFMRDVYKQNRDKRIEE